jgi:hypothetical protein
MTSSGSVTHWIQLLQAGEDEAARAIWERYFRRLVGLARARLRGAKRRVANEEDVALSVFDSFCRGLEEGRFPNLEDRDNLWKVLVVLTARKALRLVQHERRQKRGGGNNFTPGSWPTRKSETRCRVSLRENSITFATGPPQLPLGFPVCGSNYLWAATQPFPPARRCSDD